MIGKARHAGYQPQTFGSVWDYAPTVRNVTVGANYVASIAYAPFQAAAAPYQAPARTVPLTPTVRPTLAPPMVQSPPTVAPPVSFQPPAIDPAASAMFEQRLQQYNSAPQTAPAGSQWAQLATPGVIVPAVGSLILVGLLIRAIRS